MRLAGLSLLFIGLIAVIVGTFSGCNTFFGWNGRHTVDAVDIEQGHTARRLVPEPGRRYTVSVQVVFDRERVAMREGAAIVEARFPLVVRVTDPAETVRAQVSGWLDPSEPPNVLYGQSVPEKEMARTELVVERLVGPFIASSNAPLSVNVDLGADVEPEVPPQAGRLPEVPPQAARPPEGPSFPRAAVLERRLVIYDDALPPRIRSAFLLAAAGSVAGFAGVALVMGGWLRRRRGTRKRGGIRAADVV